MKPQKIVSWPLIMCCLFNLHCSSNQEETVVLALTDLTVLWGRLFLGTKNWQSTKQRQILLLSHYSTIHYHSHTIQTHQYTIDLQLCLQLYHSKHNETPFNNILPLQTPLSHHCYHSLSFTHHSDSSPIHIDLQLCLQLYHSNTMIHHSIICYHYKHHWVTIATIHYH